MPIFTEKNIAVLCNLHAGSGRAGTCGERIAAELSVKNIIHTIFTNAWPKHFGDFTDIFIVGGDGTLNYFINQYPGICLPLVLFKGGTGNDFQWLLYGTKTLDEQLEVALYADAKPIDIGICNGRYFINGVGIGFEGAVVKALTGRQKLPGKTSFLFTILKKIFAYRSATYTIQCGDKTIAGRKLLLDISNGRRAGGGFHIAPNAAANDGLLDVIIADALTVLMRLRYLPVIEKGKHLSLPFIHHFHTTNIVVKSDEPMPYHMDGEYFEADKITIKMIPGALSFRY
ncbi:diacylglycerol kinase family lipid kinase [soil metagenome]